MASSQLNRRPDRISAVHAARSKSPCASSRARSSIGATASARPFRHSLSLRLRGHSRLFALNARQYPLVTVVGRIQSRRRRNELAGFLELASPDLLLRLIEQLGRPGFTRLGLGRAVSLQRRLTPISLSQNVSWIHRQRVASQFEGLVGIASGQGGLSRPGVFRGLSRRCSSVASRFGVRLEPRDFSRGYGVRHGRMKGWAGPRSLRHGVPQQTRFARC